MGRSQAGGRHGSTYRAERRRALRIGRFGGIGPNTLRNAPPPEEPRKARAAQPVTDAERSMIASTLAAVAGLVGIRRAA